MTPQGPLGLYVHIPFCEAKCTYCHFAIDPRRPDAGRQERYLRAVLTEMTEAEGGVAEEPVLRFREFADSSINFRVRMKVRAFNDQFRIRHQFIKRLHARYGEEGIEIPFPIRTIYRGDEG